MNTLVFTSLYPNNVWPHHGVFVKERMTHFAQLPGCQVKVVAPVPYFPPIKISSRWLFSQIAREERIEGIAVHHPRYFMTPKVGMSCYGMMMFLSVLPAVRRIQRSFDCDLIDAHYVYPDGFAAVLLGRLLKKPVVVSARGSDVNRFKELSLIRPLLRYTLNKADGVIAVSQALKEAMLLLPVPEDKITVIGNGVDQRKFFPCSQVEARKKLSLPNKKIVLSVGNLTANKGFDLLVKAMFHLRTTGKGGEVFLVIVGAGTFRKDLEQMIAMLQIGDQVRLVGDIPHHELCDWYNAADLFCLASEREGWPNVVLESLACGTPVLATAVGGIPEIIRSDTIGLLTERNDRAIAETIISALQRSWDRDAIVAYAGKHGWGQVADSVQQVFVKVLSRTADRGWRQWSTGSRPTPAPRERSKGTDLRQNAQ